jgi:cytochrome c2
MRGMTRALVPLAVAVAVVAAIAGCGDATDGALRTGAGVIDPEATAQTLRAYATAPTLRERVLAASLVRGDNGYARRRLASYTTTWAALDELDPPTTPITLADAERGEPAAGATWSAIDADGAGWKSADLHALGERAFYSYPVQVAPTIPIALRATDRAGIWQHAGRTGAVWARLPGGNVAAAFTCATCHAVVEGGALVPGKNNADLDVGRIAGDGERGPRWGLGRADVTGDDVEDPIAITDLRPVRWQENLHHAATLRNDPVALAIRVETLIITSHAESVRPPRKVVAAIALFLLDLAKATPVPTGTPGAAVFARECATCHRGEGATGPAVPLAVVGTDPLVGQSTDRGTGMYRVPSLRAVGDRRRLFASGAIEDIDELLSPAPAPAARLAKGHTYGLRLSAPDRAALLEYLRAL